MNPVNKFRDYLLETDFKITILNDRIDVVNYFSIEHFDFNKVIVKHVKGSVIINGDNLVVTKLVSDEILITGNFKNILEEYGVKKCIYGHLHGFAHSLIKEGMIDGVQYVMVGCDYTGFKLIKL